MDSDKARAERLIEVQARYEQLESKYQYLQKHLNQLSSLSSTTFAMMKQESLDNLLHFIAHEIVNLTNANGAYMHMVNETEDNLLVVAASGKLEKQLMGVTRTRGVGLSARAWDLGIYQYTDSYNQYADRVTSFPEELKAVAIPLSFSGKISGVAFVTSSIDADLCSQIPLLEQIAEIASLAIYYTGQIESQSKELQRIKALSVLGETLYQSTDWHVNLNSISIHLFEIFDIDRVSFYQESLTGGTPKAYAKYVKVNNVIQSSQTDVRGVSEHNIINWCLKNNQFAQINRHVNDPRESEDVYACLKANDVGSTMCIPVGYDKKTRGVIIASKHANKRDFDQSDTDAFHSVASQISTAIQRNNLLSKVQHQAYHDSLTGLPNRRGFEQKFSDQLTANVDGKYAILFCDLDGFKNVNDTHGHDIGDKILRICAQRMNRCTHDGDYLARMGGDEFALLVKILDINATVDVMAKRLVKTLSEPIFVDDLRLQVGASIGISYYPNDSRLFSELLNNADIAMYQAKQSGKGKVFTFNKKDADEIRNNHDMRSALRSALSSNEFELWYQPQVCVESSTVIGVEALVRWNHPDGMVPPFKFIPIAEQSGLIDALGMWIVEEAISKLSSGELSKKSNLHMGVNISPPQFLDPQFSSNILLLLEKYKVDPCQLKVEITESFIMHDREIVVTQLNHLRGEGVVVAIDDFGTGYSSLSYLQDLPVDVLKIDRSFVSTLTKSNYKKSIAASIVALASSLGLSTIAEGVETAEQLKYIRKLGCEVIQGYYFAKPLPGAELATAIEKIESDNSPAFRKIA